MAKRQNASFDPMKAREAAQACIIGYLQKNEIKLPHGLTDAEYKTAMDSVTAAMVFAWTDGYWKGRE